MTAVTFTRATAPRDKHCDLCQQHSDHVALAGFGVEYPKGTESWVVAICAACSQRATRVALGHEVAR